MRDHDCNNKLSRDTYELLLSKNRINQIIDHLLQQERLEEAADHEEYLEIIGNLLNQASVSMQLDLCNHLINELFRLQHCCFVQEFLISIMRMQTNYNLRHNILSAILRQMLSHYKISEYTFGKTILHNIYDVIMDSDVTRSFWLVNLSQKHIVSLFKLSLEYEAWCFCAMIKMLVKSDAEFAEALAAIDFYVYSREALCKIIAMINQPISVADQQYIIKIISQDWYQDSAYNNMRKVRHSMMLIDYIEQDHQLKQHLAKNLHCDMFRSFVKKMSYCLANDSTYEYQQIKKIITELLATDMAMDFKQTCDAELIINCDLDAGELENVESMLNFVISILNLRDKIILNADSNKRYNPLVLISYVASKNNCHDKLLSLFLLKHVEYVYLWRVTKNEYAQAIMQKMVSLAPSWECCNHELSSKKMNFSSLIRKLFENIKINEVVNANFFVTIAKNGNIKRNNILDNLLMVLGFDLQRRKPHMTIADIMNMKLVHSTNVLQVFFATKIQIDLMIRNISVKKSIVGTGNENAANSYSASRFEDFLKRVTCSSYDTMDPKSQTLYIKLFFLFILHQKIKRSDNKIEIPIVKRLSEETPNLFAINNFREFYYMYLAMDHKPKILYSIMNVSDYTDEVLSEFDNDLRQSLAMITKDFIGFALTSFMGITGIYYHSCKKSVFIDNNYLRKGLLFLIDYVNQYDDSVLSSDQYAGPEKNNIDIFQSMLDMNGIVSHNDILCFTINLENQQYKRQLLHIYKENLYKPFEYSTYAPVINNMIIEHAQNTIDYLCVAVSETITAHLNLGQESCVVGAKTRLYITCIESNPIFLYHKSRLPQMEACLFEVIKTRLEMILINNNVNQIFKLLNPVLSVNSDNAQMFLLNKELISYFSADNINDDKTQIGRVSLEQLLRYLILSVPEVVETQLNQNISAATGSFKYKEREIIKLLVSICGGDNVILKLVDLFRGKYRKELAASANATNLTYAYNMHASKEITMLSLVSRIKSANYITNASKLVWVNTIKKLFPEHVSDECRKQMAWDLLERLLAMMANVNDAVANNSVDAMLTDAINDYLNINNRGSLIRI